MSDWNHNIIFICPITYIDNAKQLARALDPDVGGYESFSVLASENGQLPATYIICTTPARQTFITELLTISSDATALKTVVDADYAVRWQGEIPPTLLECETLLANLQIFIDEDLNSVLSSLNLQLIR